MLAIEVIANTMLVLLLLGVSLIGFNRLLQKVIENSYAKIAQVEASTLDEQWRQMQNRNGGN